MPEETPSVPVAEAGTAVPPPAAETPVTPDAVTHTLAPDAVTHTLAPDVVSHTVRRHRERTDPVTTGGVETPLEAGSRLRRIEQRMARKTATTG